MLKYVIPIWDLIEENSTHDFFFFFFSFCFKFGKEVTKKTKENDKCRLGWKQVGYPSLEVSLMNLVNTTLLIL